MTMDRSQRIIVLAEKDGVPIGTMPMTCTMHLTVNGHEMHFQSHDGPNVAARLSRRGSAHHLISAAPLDVWADVVGFRGLDDRVSAFSEVAQWHIGEARSLRGRASITNNDARELAIWHDECAARIIAMATEEAVS